MKYQWTDWITHVPGQQLPVGTHGIWEFVGRDGVASEKEGTLNSSHRNHPCWFADNPYGMAKMITRYKLRSIAEENEVVSERELDLVE